MGNEMMRMNSDLLGKPLFVIVSIIAIMVSVSVYVQVLPLVQQWQQEDALKQKNLEKNRCIDEARNSEPVNFTKWNECLR